MAVIGMIRFILAIILFQTVTGFADDIKIKSMTIKVNKKSSKKHKITLKATEIDLSGLEKYLESSVERRKKVESDFPKHVNGNVGSSSLNFEFSTSFHSSSLNPYTIAHANFVQNFGRMKSNKIVSQGNVPGDIIFNSEELMWWKNNFVGDHLNDKKFVDYQGNSYSIKSIDKGAIQSSASIWDAGLPTNRYRTKPEEAYRGSIFTLNLDKRIKPDPRFGLIKEIPLWLVDANFSPTEPQKFQHKKLMDKKIIAEIRGAVKKHWPSSQIDNRLSFYELVDTSESKIYSVAVMIDRCRDGWNSWKKKCKAMEKKNPWWVYLGIDIKNKFKMINLGGHSNAGFAISGKDPGYRVSALGDLNRNGLTEFLFYSDDRAEGYNVASIYEIKNGISPSIWNWTDFQE